MTNLGDYEPYEHTVPEWTVGQLRQALASVPNDTPVRIAIPKELTHRGPDDDQDASYVVTGTSPADPQYDTLLGDGDGDEVLVLVADYPSATYMRRRADAG
ncbi:hypothetical protein ABIA32_000867 [Streptacidiphilus sp. MAP12-20]|uniref:DUF6225 family protein n=1 Tax=Streptacidiphilus sp. MAP12-20 TaxID=3156299 RepID=UPI0035137AC1